jgi:hypothetical protein
MAEETALREDRLRHGEAFAAFLGKADKRHYVALSGALREGGEAFVVEGECGALLSLARPSARKEEFRQADEIAASRGGLVYDHRGALEVSLEVADFADALPDTDDEFVHS